MTPANALALAALVATACVAAPAAAADRFAVVIGHNRGAVGEAPLHFAEDDAAKVYETLRDVGGFSAADMTLLVGESVDEVRGALAAINARVRASDASVLVVYYSGHADEAALHLGSEAFPTAELSDLVAGSAARFRVLVVDACRSGAIARRKGGVPDLPIAIAAQSPVGAEGFVVLTASSAGEDAQESDLLRGSFFTHHWVSGLRGAADVDSDGEVSLEESYRHAFTNTVRQSSATLAGTQHPTYRYDVTGAGSIVLARPRNGKRGATVAFPPGLSFLLFDDNAAGRVVAELPAESPARALRLETGRYFVRGRGVDALYEGDVDVGVDDVSVDTAAFERIDYARLVRKGAGVRASSHEVTAGYAMRTTLHGALGDTGLCHGARAGYAFALRYVNIDVRAGGCVGGYDNRFVAAQESEGAVDVGLAAVFDVPFASVGVGGFFGGAVLQQTFTTPGEAPPRTSSAGVLGLRGSGRVPLPAGFTAGVDVEGATYVFSRQLAEEARPEAQLVGRAAVVVGWQF